MSEPDPTSGVTFKVHVNAGRRISLPNGVLYDTLNTYPDGIDVLLDSYYYTQLVPSDFQGTNPLLVDLGPVDQNTNSGSSILYAPVGDNLVPKLYSLSGQRIITSSSTGAQYARTNASFWSTRQLYITNRALDQNVVPGFSEISYDGWNWSTAMSSKIYLADNGFLTQAVPNDGDWVARIIGYAIDTNTIFFNPFPGIYLSS